MKLLTNLIGMAAAGTIGYMTEPKLRFDLTGIQPSKTEIAASGRVVINMPGDRPEVDISKLTSEELPLKVVVSSDVKVADIASGLNMTISAGSQVNLIRIEGGNAVVSPAGTQAVGLIPIVETDLVDQIAKGLVTKGSPTPTPSAAPNVAKGGDSQEPVAIPEAPPMPEPAPTPPPAPPAPEPAPAPIPIPEPPPAVEPAPTPEPTPAPAEPAGSSVDVVKVMQESIRTAQIKEFTFAQVLDWKADADETVDGESYQTGLASYKAETIFGVKTIQAKALIKNGKVQRWIWPKSGMDIK